MIRGPLQEPRRPSHFLAWLGGQRLFAGLPNRHRALHTHNILQAEFGESIVLPAALFPLVAGGFCQIKRGGGGGVPGARR